MGLSAEQAVGMQPHMGNAIVQDLMDQLSSVDAALQALKQNKHKKKSKRISIWKLNCKVKTSPEVEVVEVEEEMEETHGCAICGRR